MMDATEEKKVTIEPLAAPPTAPGGKKPKAPGGKRGPKPKPKPAKMPKEELLQVRMKNLEKGKEVRLKNALKRKIEKTKKYIDLKDNDIQTMLGGKATSTQGYHYDPSIDNDASLKKSAIHAPPETGGLPYQPPNAYTLTPDYSAQLDRMNRIENLLSQFVNVQTNPNHVPQNAASVPSHHVETHKTTLFNTNPYLSRRYRK